MVKKWLMCAAVQFSVHYCIDAAVTILRAGGRQAYIKCLHCSSAHHNGCPNSCCSTSRHLCSTCGKSWTPDSDVSGNPLAVFLLVCMVIGYYLHALRVMERYCLL